MRLFGAGSGRGFHAIAAAVLIAAGFGTSPLQAANLFGLVDTGELYASGDNGVTWSIHATLPVNDAIGLAAGISTLDLYLATRSGTIHHSSDGGANWTAVGALAASDAAGFTLAPFGDVLVLTRSGTLYASSDGGASFAAIAALTGSNWVSLARGRLVGYFYALTETGEVAESADSGATWTVKGALTVSNAVSIRAMGSDLFILTATGEIAKRTDAGVSWITVGALTQSGMSALLNLGTTTLCAAAETGEIATSADGASWTWVGAINQLKVMALGADTPTVTGVDATEGAPKFVAGAPFPNPTPRETGATFSIRTVGPERIRLEVYDARGRMVAARPFVSYANAGIHSFRWAPRGLAAGTYVARYIAASGRARSAKWTVIR
jgi:hypothetical protein